MGAIGYLVFARMRNQILSLKKNPARLIYILVIFALIFVTLLGGNEAQGTPTRDLHELIAGVLALYTLIFLMLVNGGFKNGANMFALSDVNLLFPAPVAPAGVLFYGLFRQIGSSFLLGFFILFQYTWLHQLFGVSYGVLLAILAGYMLTAFFAQLMAMLFYSVTSGDERKRSRLRRAFFGVYAAFIAYALVNSVNRGGFSFAALTDVASGPVMLLMPVSGWLTAAFSGVLLGDAIPALMGCTLSVVLLTGAVAAILKMNHDFYEDVLKAAEITHSAITDKKEGQLRENVPENVRLGSTGLRAGFGADAIYYKHRLESRRARRFLLTPTGLAFAAVTIAMALFLKGAGLFAVFGMSVYMQLFAETTSRFSRELVRPFLYMIPERPFLKLWNALRVSLRESLADSVVTFVPVGLILRLNAPEIAACVFARWTFSLVFTAANVLEERVFGSLSSKFFMVFFYILAALGIAAPGVVLAVVLTAAGLTPLGGAATALTALGVLNIPMALLVLFLCRNMLSCAECNNR